jgi:hypothetical protein
MKNLFLSLTLLLFLIPKVHAQGTNNDFEFDTEDFQFLFSKLGYGVFKFPVKQSKDQIFDIVIEEYEDGKLTQTQTAIETTNKAFEGYGIDAKAYVIPRMDSTQLDSVYFHRFYSEETDTAVTINVKTHGLTVPVKFDVTNLAVGNVRAKYETKEEIDKNGFMEVEEKKLLLFFYANKDENKPLFCPAGLPKEKIIKQFDYSVFVYITPIE